MFCPILCFSGPIESKKYQLFNIVPFFPDPKHVMFRGKADAQRDLLFKMLEKTTGKTINYRMLAIYLGHLVQMFVETNENLAVFWTRYTAPVQRYKTEHGEARQIQGDRARSEEKQGVVYCMDET